MTKILLKIALYIHSSKSISFWQFQSSFKDTSNTFTRNKYTDDSFVKTLDIIFESSERSPINLNLNYKPATYNCGTNTHFNWKFLFLVSLIDRFKFCTFRFSGILSDR